MRKSIRILCLNILIVFIISEVYHCKGQTIANEKAASYDKLWNKLDELCVKESGKVIAWRRDIHQNPELGNREFRTSEIIAAHLRKLGLEVQTGIAHTGVVGILKGKYEGPVIAIRADMDALPVRELADVPFASKVTASYNGQETPVMHACGHDAHVAIVMGAAEALAAERDRLHGTVKFIFQPAEDSKPDNEDGGAELMIREGVLKNPDVNAIIGLHVVPYPASTIKYKPGGIFAAVDNFTITVKGRQVHGALPWAGIDPITVSAQIISGLQTIISRQIDITEAPALITIGTIHGGVQQNIVPGEVVMKGTIRTFSKNSREQIFNKVRMTAGKIAEASGATAEVSIFTGVPVVMNDQDLTAKFAAIVTRVAGNSGTSIATPITVGDDFSLYTEKIPGFYFLLGVAPEGADPARIVNHSPFFIVDETALVKGVQALSHITAEYLK